MDAAYRGNAKKHLMYGVYELLIGIPVRLVAALLFILIEPLLT